MFNWLNHCFCWHMCMLLSHIPGSFTLAITLIPITSFWSCMKENFLKFRFIGSSFLKNTNTLLLSFYWLPSFPFSMIVLWWSNLPFTTYRLFRQMNSFSKNSSFSLSEKHLQTSSTEDQSSFWVLPSYMRAYKNAFGFLMNSNYAYLMFYFL